MTPLTLNLLTEELEAEAASARDPVKFAILIGIVLWVATAGYGVWVMFRADQKKAEATRLQKRWDEMTAKPSGGTFRSLKTLAEDLVSIHQRRMLLAPQLARIKDLVPSTIYLTRLSFKMNVEVITIAVPAAKGDAIAASRQTQNSEFLSLRLEGTAIGAPPELEVDGFLKILRTDPVLSNQVREVTLRSIARAMTDGTVSGRSVMAQFVIECLYKERR